MKQEIKLITPQELMRLLESEKDIVILDTREELEFSQGHIPAAISNQWFEWCSKAPSSAKSALFEPGYWGNLNVESIEKVERALGNLGITNDGTVVVYSGGIASKGREGRLAWMLLYFGIEKVYILDGGYNAWLQAKGYVSTKVVSEEERQAKQKKFKVSLQPQRRVELTDVKKMLEEDGGTHPILVDTRSPLEFEGRLYDYQPRMGHIPRSVNIWFDRYFAKDGKFIGEKEFLNLLESEKMLSNVKASYCEVGVRAATFSLLFELATGKVLPVYDGSLMEWSHHSDLTVISSCQSDSDTD
jgi:thiosulfate/3-mercaptopyruvate sulfurtransferase